MFKRIKLTAPIFIAFFMIMILTAANFALSAQPVNEQQQQRARKFDGRRLTEKMRHELNLTEEQTEQVAKINAEFAQKRQAMRQAAKDPEQPLPDRKALRDAYIASLKQVLTPQQFELLAKKWEQKRQERQQNFQKNSAIRQETRQEIKAYVDKNVLPTAKVQRTKLDRYIEPTDKQKIDELRNKLNTLKPKIQAEREKIKTMRQNGQKPTDEQHQNLRALQTEMRSIRAAAKPLAEKYKDQIQTLHNEIKPDIERWKADIKVIAKDGLKNDQFEGKFKERKQKLAQKRKEFGERGMHYLKGVGFILLDPQSRTQTPGR